MGAQGNMGKHLMVDELVSLGGLDGAAQYEDIAEILRLENLDLLKSALPRKERALHLEGNA
jgi:hypothetical protein